MATTLDNDVTYVSFPIVKVDKTDDGDLLVWGKATDGSVDADDQIVDLEWSASALKTWLSTGGNVRVMHSAQHLPAGKGVEVDSTQGDGHWVRSLVVEPTAKRLVEKGVLQAYSIGISRPKIVRDSLAKGGRIVGGIVHELSLVDRPANKNCGIQLLKSASDGTAQDVAELFGEVEEALAKAAEQAAKAAKPDATDPGDTTDADPDESTEPDEPAASDADSDTEGGQDRDDEPGATEADQARADDGDAQKSAWAMERADWLAVEPKLGAESSGTVFLAKRAEWQRWSALGADAGLTEDGYPTWVSKRDVDPNVGGGVDRDKLQPGDFVFPDERAFPVVTPGDVSDAVSSWGRYKGTRTFDEFKKKLRKLCKRKGDAFVAGLPEEWKTKGVEAALAKADGKGAGVTATKGDKDCPDCHATYHADSKLRSCSECGADLPTASKADAGATTTKPSTLPPAAPADDDTDDDKPAATKGADYATARMHDAVCAAYHWDTVAAEYPSLKGVPEAIQPRWFQTQVLDAATKGDMPTVANLAALAVAAGELAKADAGDMETAAVLADARAGLHKAFTDMYPTDRPTPGEMTPGRFQRPYVAAGHATLTARPSQSPRIPAATHTPDPDQYTRGPLTEGHQSPPPGSTGDNNPVPSVATGAVRTYYTRASRDAARNAMAAMHDHIAQTFPDMCPLSGGHVSMSPSNGAASRPVPVSPGDSAKAPGEKAAMPTDVKVKKPKRDKTASPVDVAAIVKSTVTGAVNDAVTKALAEVTSTYEPQLAALKAGLDELGAQPDPAQAPPRGVIGKATTTQTTPVEKVSLVEKAQGQVAADKAQLAAYLQRMAGSPDPSIREQAEAALARLLGS